MNNLIYRDKAIEVISKLPVKVDNLGYTWMIAGDVLKQIDDMPPAELECKKGEWLDTGCKKIYKCSECGNYLDFDGVNAGRGDANFCPNCGADMRDEK